MTPDQYLALVLSMHQPSGNANLVRFTVDPIITRWAGMYLNSISQSGSIAKGTAVKGGSDLDLFVSIKTSCPDNLKDIYSSLANAFLQSGHKPRAQNVSIGLTLNGTNVDITPGQQQPGLYNSDHSLWKNRLQTWTKTNIQTHVTTILGCGRIQEIKLAKIWRNKHHVDFPSFYLELAVIEALSGVYSYSISNRFLRILEYLAGDFQYSRFVDPANSANVISDDLNANEKKAIAARATQSLRDLSTDWRRVIW